MQKLLVYLFFIFFFLNIAQIKNLKVKISVVVHWGFFCPVEEFESEAILGLFFGFFTGGEGEGAEKEISTRKRCWSFSR